jgi:hypothetical protein
MANFHLHQWQFCETHAQIEALDAVAKARLGGGRAILVPLSEVENVITTLQAEGYTFDESIEEPGSNEEPDWCKTMNYGGAPT